MFTENNLKRNCTRRPTSDVLRPKARREHASASLTPPKSNFWLRRGSVHGGTLICSLRKRRMEKRKRSATQRYRARVAKLTARLKACIDTPGYKCRDLNSTLRACSVGRATGKAVLNFDARTCFVCASLSVCLQAFTAAE